MSCWDILGIAPTKDKKEIKLVYAQLLKQNKPDENPQGFSQLHNAYKQSLKYASDKTEALQVRHSLKDNTPRKQYPPSHLSDDQDSFVEINGHSAEVDSVPVVEIDQEDREYIASPYQDEPVKETNEDLDGLSIDVADIERQINTEIIEDVYVNETVALNDGADTINEEALFEKLDIAWQRIIVDTDVAFKKLNSVDIIDSWSFIHSCNEMYDFQFKEKYSFYVFNRLIEFFEESDIQPRNRPKTIKHLGSFFSWLIQQENFEFEYGYDEVAPIFDVLQEINNPEARSLQWVVPKKHIGPMVYGNYYARIAAMVIDVFVIYMVVDTLNFSGDGFLSVVYSLLVYFFLIPILEASPLQGGLGKIIFGMKVTNKTGKRLNIFQAYWRQILYTIITAAFKVTVWINFFLNDGRLLHDRLSVSRVIKR